MILRFYIVLACILGFQIIYAQGIQDSVFLLQGVEIKASPVFEKENAGMKNTKIDSVILVEKINMSLSDILSQNTTVFIKDYGRGALSTASFRGTAASHTQLNWNGLKINSPSTGMVDFSLIPVYIIDEMDLKYGSASLADHSGGLGGSVNISNQVDWNNKIGIKYVQEIGSYKTFDEFLQFSAGNKKIQSKTRAYHNYSKNDYTFINHGIADIDPETGEITNPLDTNKNADFTRFGLIQELYYSPAPTHIVSAKYWFQQSERTIPKATSYEGPDNSNLNRQNDNDHKLVADWKYFLDHGNIVVRSGFTRKKLEYVLMNQVVGVGQIPAIYSESDQKSLLNRIAYLRGLKRNFSIEARIDGNWYNVVSQDTVKKTGYENDRSEISLFMSLDKNFASRLNLKLMLRQEWVDLKATPFIPYFGFDLSLIKDKELILKGNIARNYHQPSLNDLYWQPGGNPDLQAEQGFSFELSLQYRLLLKQHLIQTELTAFRSHIDNWIIWIPSYKGYWEPKNIQRVLSTGIEFGLKIKGSFGKLGYTVSGNYAYTSSVNYGDPLVWGDESCGKQLPYVPLHSGNAMINLSYSAYFITYQHNSYSERYTTTSNDITSRGQLYPYFMNDLSFGKEFRFDKITLSGEFKILNLFNESYYSVLYRPMPGRNYMFVLLVNFNK